MPMYVQRCQAGAPTTTHLDSYLADNVPPDSTAQLAADAGAIHEQLNALPVPDYVPTAHLRAAEDPELMYERNGVSMPARAFLSAAPPPPVAPVPPSPPPPPADGCSSAERAAYDASYAAYQKDEFAYAAARKKYVADCATYQTLTQRRSDLAKQVASFNVNLANFSSSSASSSSSPSWSSSSTSSWPSSSSPSSSGSATATALQAVAQTLEKLRHDRRPVTHVLAAVEAADAQIVRIAKNADADAGEAGIAAAMAIHDEIKRILDDLALRASESVEDEATRTY